MNPQLQSTGAVTKPVVPALNFDKMKKRDSGEQGQIKEVIKERKRISRKKSEKVESDPLMRSNEDRPRKESKRFENLQMPITRFE